MTWQGFPSISDVVSRVVDSHVDEPDETAYGTDEEQPATDDQDALEAEGAYDDGSIQG